MDHNKVKTMLKWESPTNKIKIYRLLGLNGYYKRFIKTFFYLSLFIDLVN